MHVDNPATAWPLLPVGGGLEVVAKTVRRQAQVESRLAVAPNRRGGEEATRGSQAKPGDCRGGAGGLEKVSFGELHRRHSTAKPLGFQL